MDREAFELLKGWNEANTKAIEALQAEVKEMRLRESAAGGKKDANKGMLVLAGGVLVEGMHIAIEWFRK